MRKPWLAIFCSLTFTSPLFAHATGDLAFDVGTGTGHSAKVSSQINENTAVIIDNETGNTVIQTHLPTGVESTPTSFHRPWCERHPERCEEMREERRERHERWCKKHPKKCEQQQKEQNKKPS